MTKILITILLIVGSFSLADAKPRKNHLTISIEDKDQYSEEFVTELDTKFEDLYTSIDLEDNLLILDKRDTMYFPEEPVMEEIYTLKASNKMWISELTVERINQTSIKFNVAFTDRLGYKIAEKGIATLSPSFILGSESDDINGEVYYLVYVHRDGNRNIAIRLGIEKGTENLLIGRIQIAGIERCSIIETDRLPVYKEVTEK